MLLVLTISSIQCNQDLVVDAGIQGCTENKRLSVHV